MVRRRGGQFISFCFRDITEKISCVNNLQTFLRNPFVFFIRCIDTSLHVALHGGRLPHVSLTPNATLF